MPVIQPQSTRFVSSAPPAAAAKAHAILLKQTSLQFDFSAFKAPPPPAWLEWLLNYVVRPLGWLLSQPLARVAIGAALVGLIGWGAFLLLRAFLKRGWDFRRGEQPVSSTAPSWSLSPAKAQLLLADADALAAQGRFAEAIHHLLLRSVSDISERRPELLKPALTSREIATLAGLPETAREAFSAIAGVVERTIFAGRPVDAADYATCRDEYERFALPDLWKLRRAA